MWSCRSDLAEEGVVRASSDLGYLSAVEIRWTLEPPVFHLGRNVIRIQDAFDIDHNSLFLASERI